MQFYLKYRPNSFKEVVGQKIPKFILKSQLKDYFENGKLQQSYIFYGPRGTGKTTLARIFAKSINCENFDTKKDCCNECKFCDSINKDISNNANNMYIEIDGASNNGVDAIKKLIENIKYRPMNGGKRVIVIDEAHMLSNSAFNAMLKTIEEPKKFNIFIFVTTEIDKIVDTIKSRSLIVNFDLISDEDLKQKLNEIIDKEDIELDNKEDVLDLIVKNAGGIGRDAVKHLQTIASFSDEIKGDIDTLAKIFNTINDGSIKNFIEIVENGNNTNKILDHIDKFKKITNYDNFILLLKNYFIKNRELNNGFLKVIYECLKLGINDYNSFAIVLLNSLNSLKQKDANFIKTTTQLQPNNTEETIIKETKMLKQEHTEPVQSIKNDKNKNKNNANVDTQQQADYNKDITDISVDENNEEKINQVDDEINKELGGGIDLYTKLEQENFFDEDEKLKQQSNDVNKRLGKKIDELFMFDINKVAGYDLKVDTSKYTLNVFIEKEFQEEAFNKLKEIYGIEKDNVNIEGITKKEDIFMNLLFNNNLLFNKDGFKEGIKYYIKNIKCKGDIGVFEYEAMKLKNPNIQNGEQYLDILVGILYEHKLLLEEFKKNGMFNNMVNGSKISIHGGDLLYLDGGVEKNSFSMIKKIAEEFKGNMKLTNKYNQGVYGKKIGTALNLPNKLFWSIYYGYNLFVFKTIVGKYISDGKYGYEGVYNKNNIIKNSKILFKTGTNYLV